MRNDNVGFKGIYSNKKVTSTGAWPDDHWITYLSVIMRSSPTGGNFFAAVKSFDVNIANPGNYVLNAKNPSVSTSKHLYNST